MPDTNNATQETSENLCETADKMGQKLRSVVDSASGDMGNLGDRLAKQITEKPMQSALIALGIGAVLGLLLSR